MRIARIRTAEGPRTVIADGDDWVAVDEAYAAVPAPTGERYPREGVELLAPCDPRVVLGMAHNSGEEDRLKAPQAFHKSSRTVVGPGAPIVLDPRRGHTVGEGELVLVVGKHARDVSVEDAPDHILGWTIGNDVSCVAQADHDHLLTQVKNGDGFTPLGPWIETDLDALDAVLTMRRNGEEVARSTTKRLAWNPYECLAYATAHMTLGAGDVILTGAPWTTFDVEAGDTVECAVAGLGTLANPVVSREA